MKKQLGSLLVTAGLALFTADRTMAANITVPAGSILWSQITPAPTSGDSVNISGNATVYVDMDAVAGRIIIGDASNPATLAFDSVAPHTLTLSAANGQSGSVEFGGASGNQLNMSASTLNHTIKVAGNFLVSGAGTFTSGFGTVVYNGDAAQSVTGKSYKNLTLSGSGAKTFLSGAAITGLLSIQEGATVAGVSPTYGGFASLEYKGNVEQTTTSVEWPATMTVPVLIANTAKPVKLNGDKTLNSTLTINTLSVLDNNNKTLTVKGNIVNNGTQQGAGTLVLAGTSAQTLTGGGSYANLTINNASGVTAPSGGLFVAGRLRLTAGKLTLSGTTSTTLLMTYLGADQKTGGTARTYGSSSAVGGVDVADDNAFGGTGKITLAANKPAATFTLPETKPTITYGDGTVTVSGTVGGGANGNGPLDGDNVTITLMTSPSRSQNVQTSGGNGSFTATINTASLAAGTYDVIYDYKGGDNLSATPHTEAGGFIVKQLAITVTPNSQTKVYAAGDPPLTYNVSPNLLAGDTFSGTLVRDLAGTGPGGSGENVGKYYIRKGTLSTSPNYSLTVDETKQLEIVKRDLLITANAKSKTYGQPDPGLDFIQNPPTLPVPGDSVTGALVRDAGEDVGSYTIKQGTVKVEPGDNYNIIYTPAQLTINKLSVTVTVASANRTKTYGQADPALTPVPTPALVLGDTFSGGLKRTAGDHAGSYPISQGDLTIVNGDKNKIGNYNLTVNSPAFVINKKDVTVDADSKTISYGDAIPSGIKYTGLINDDTLDNPPTVGNWNPSKPTVTTLPGSYNFTVDISGASDPDYNVKAGVLTGVITIQKRALTLTAVNKTKVEDGSVFPTGSYTVSDNYANNDTFATAFTAGSLVFSGPSQSATAAGVYDINVAGSGLTSEKYVVPPTFVSGALSITKAIATTDVTGDVIWAGGESHSWRINQANGGTAGSSPGWTLLNIKASESPTTTGKLTITADAGNQFTINLTTLQLASPTAGAMAKFDPTRSYSWKFVQAAGGIVGFDAAKFKFKSEGVGLFANNTYGGTFGITQPNANELDITFTPKSQSLVDVGSLLPAMKTSDVDVLYLETSSTAPNPTDHVTVSLKVANLKQPVFGAQAYVAFSSQYFNADATGANAPVVAAGGGVWDTVIYKIWNTSGYLDTVIGLNFLQANGTVADGTVATITLTPKRTAVGTSRVVFRTGLDEAPIGAVSGGTLLSIANGASVQPARVPTPDIVIAGDDKAPVIDSDHVTATQEQYGVAQNVKNGPSVADDPVYSTNTVRGAVMIAVPVTDAGVGLNGAPTVALAGPGGASGSATLASGPAPVNGFAQNGTYNYSWTVDGTTANGQWTATVTAGDNLGQSSTATFKLTVNHNEVTGVVEVGSFTGTNRTVNFKAGNGSAVTKSWDLPLTFTNTRFLSAGNFRDLPDLANQLVNPSGSAAATSAYLRYGSIADLATLADRLLNGTDGVATYLRDLEFGVIKDKAGLDSIAARLKTPTRSIDAYVKGELSTGTITALNNYPSDASKATADQIAALETGILNDFNAIVLGPSIYDPLRFQSVVPPVTSDPRIDPDWFPPYSDAKPAPTGSDLMWFNRYLLNDAYKYNNGTVESYIEGQLNAQTVQALLNYGGGADSTLTQLVLMDFDTLTLPASAGLWVDPSSPNVGLYSEMRFLGISLRTETANLVLAEPAVDSTDMVKMNRMLLEDAFAVSLGNLNYSSGLVTPETGAALDAFVAVPNAANQAILDPLLVADLNAAMDAGKITRAQLETAYPTQITKAKTLVNFKLIGVPAGTTKISAKTAWNLRSTMDVAGVDPGAVVNFVNGEGVVTDHDLKAGDGTNDNVIGLGDYSVLVSTYGQTGAGLPADFNGDSKVNIIDYNILVTSGNYGKQGDLGVDGKP